MRNGQSKMRQVKENGGANIIKSGGGFLQIAFLGLILAAVFVSGCDEGGSGSSSAALLKGSFVDSPVEGLEYDTETQFGVTDADGTFMYKAGENVTFHVGDIVLGTAPAQPLMTPIDLVAGATDVTHPMVTNMARLLQTLDADMNPENGIMITEEMAAAMVNHMIDFNMGPAAFEYDPNVRMFLETMNSIHVSDTFRMMVSTEDAQDHFRNTMNAMMSGDSGVETDNGMMGNDTGMTNGNTGMTGNTGTGMPGNTGMVSSGNNRMMN